MLNVAEALKQTNALLSQAGIENARLDARLLIEHALGLGDHGASLVNERPVCGEEYQRLQSLVERRAGREPLAYIVAEREFWSLPFKVSPATLVPRPDSETIIEAALKTISNQHAPLSVLDLGTGSGCLLLSLLHELPQASGLGIDRCPDALNIARQNAMNLDLSERASFVCMDWFSGLDAKFDIIVCNPPYIPQNELATLMPEVSKFEPHHALSGGVDGLESIHAIAAGIPDLLKINGRIFFEIGMNQAANVIDILTGNGLQVVDIKEDLSGTPRCIVAELSRSQGNEKKTN